MNKKQPACTKILSKKNLAHAGETKGLLLKINPVPGAAALEPTTGLLLHNKDYNLAAGN